MRRYLATVMILLVVVSAFPIVSVWAKGPPDLQQVIFIHPARPKPPPGGGGGDSGYFKLLGPKLATTAKIEINPSDSNLASSALLNAITVSAEEWDDGVYSGWGGVPPNLFEVSSDFSAKTYANLAWTSDKMDGSNTLVWGDYPNSNVIAVTIVWYSRATKTIIEFDMVFDKDYTWSVSGEAGKMDLQNIATHELGHAAGLADLYQGAAYQETMYGYGSPGEISKRDLYLGDKQGITKLYG